MDQYESDWTEKELSFLRFSFENGNFTFLRMLQMALDSDLLNPTKFQNKTLPVFKNVGFWFPPYLQIPSQFYETIIPYLFV